ncbi:5-hydroxytryptamine receptor 2B-like [Toxorhynchites rutilus septentrionalis]|uniref:5-hydroxytryptamine receptor 2B-like n=1 Tax=Toxorhynchites rutilus septentrionalis TaxID=329112 RepID=UPI00247A6B37|nr:5-hydroxytryptamine receptor 2B-like [Toxorhynchites rutilus septentrionalis]XP_055630363.1 5-hydroxytryptamine receptor 2B-like [Toxorhynchites rutilus septentrionalis]XP_055630364.1 5-hydroxytryptamine receptor 2B-like [Toxorhynchites rutilus septentrionalis]XP_055630365.1 5-hydroxytryptamine receptor 2B-like [Toxorhynchites rutilus septentrionalis]
MDFHEAPPPRPPSLGTTFTKSNDVYDYIFIDSGSPDSYLAGELGSLVNDTLLLNGTALNTNGSDLAGSGNGTTGGLDEPLADVIAMAVTSLILGLMILVTVIGNVFVIAAIILERNLQNVANYLVASLAVADLLVACLVMPLGAVYEISRGWILGPELCDIWTSCDVLCCTASILHLVAIATDRYWAVTNIDYMHSRTSRRVFTMIFLVWFASVIVSLAPQFGWKDPDYLQRIEQQKCMVSQNIGYQIFATCCTFYVPLLVILVLYWKIYQTARRRIHRRRPKPPPVTGNNNQEQTPKQTKSKIRFRLKKKFSNPAKSAASSLGLVEGNSTNTVNLVEDTDTGNANSDQKAGIETAFSSDETAVTAVTNSQIPTVSQEVDHRQLTEPLEANNNNHNNNNNSAAESNTHQQNTQSTLQPTSNNVLLPPVQNSPTPLGAAAHTGSTLNIASTPNPHAQVSKRKETLEAKRERKAAKTLAIITGAFVVCWLPFFLMALLLPLCESCSINDTVASLFLWLGYFNSTLNPVIYTIFSPEFRQAFKRILFGSHRSTTYRRGQL